MTVLDLADAAVVCAAGAGAGFAVSSVGAGSLVSFPLLLSVGVPPVTANASNTVGLVAGGFSGAWGYRRELAGRRGLVGAVAVTSAAGAVVGAVLLLALPAGAFEAVVGPLVLVAAALVAVQPFVVRAVARRHGDRRGDGHARPGPAMLASTTVLGVYGGYFGAGQGVAVTATLGLAVDVGLRVVNACKTVAVLAANVAATAVFVVAAPLDWPVVALLSAGSLVGGYAGAVVGRRLPELLLRVLVVTFATAVGLVLVLR